VPASITLITLGVADVEASRRFYEALGFRASRASVAGEVAFFQAGGVALAVWGREALAADAKLGDSDAGFAAIAIARNMASKAEVDEALAAARRAGGRVAKPAIDTPWGGYSGYFTDPDGHLWEVAWNPHFTLLPDGSLRLP
jgi:predicted lactoylglutathione lyase